MITFQIQTDMFQGSRIEFYDPFSGRKVEEAFIAGKEREKEITILRRIIHDGAKQMASQRKNNLTHAPDGMSYTSRVQTFDKLDKAILILKSAQIPFFINKANEVKTLLIDIQPGANSRFYAGYLNRLNTLDSLIAQLKTFHEGINN
jgi:hypothetical protein